LSGLLSGRDWVYLLSLLVPLVVYDLALKVLSVASVPGLTPSFDLIRSDVFFGMGYALLWIGLFAMVGDRRLLRRTVVILFHVVTVFVVVVNTGAYQYFQETGATLGYDTIIGWSPRFDGNEPILRGVPLPVWILLAAALFYVTLGPVLVTRVVTRPVGRRGRWEKSRTGRLGVFSSLVSLGLCFLGLGFGTLSLDAGTTALVRDPLVNVIVSVVEGRGEGNSDSGAAAEGVEAPKEDGSNVGTAIQGAEVPEEDSSDAGTDVENPAAHATLAPTSQTEKRNVVLVHLESTRARSVTPYNEDLHTTPFLNELAKQSLLVEQAHVGDIPRSSMSSASVNCGIQPPPRPGADEPGSMPVPCLANLLRDQGYSTAFFSSNADEYGDLAAKNWGYEKVFAPPVPGVPPQYQDTTMQPEKFVKPSHYGYEEDIMLKPSENWLGGHKNAPFMAEYLLNTGHDEYNCLGTRYGSENFSNDDLLNHYLNCLKLQDVFLQKLIEQYKALGLYDNTIFVLFGDHGEGFGEHGRFMHGDTIWEEGLRTPLVIHAPGLTDGGERVGGLSNYTDILPTVVEMLGYEVKNGEYPGYSLLHPVPENRTLNFSCISPLTCLASIKGNEKYIYHFDNQPEEVFDLSKDPLEEHNLADQYSKEDLDKRRRGLFAWLSKIDAQYGHGSLSWGTQSEESPVQRAGQSSKPTVAVGQPLAVGDLVWTVTSAHPTNQLTSSTDGGTKRGNFVVVDYQLKNNSSEGLDVSTQSLTLLDGSGRRYGFDTDTYLYVPWSLAIFRFEVGSGDSEEGEFIFEVPQGASKFQLQLGGRNPFSDESGYVNLGF
jgi:Sulfatase/Domain of unknown function (DUF4352)